MSFRMVALLSHRDLSVFQTLYRVGFPEEFGLGPMELTPGYMVAALKEVGFDLVFDTNVAADLTIMEEGTELLTRVKSRLENPPEKDYPLFTSCCPGWMNTIGKIDPEMVQEISTSKSPHMMYGAMVKEYSQEMLGVKPEEIYFCSVMPCVRKRAESDEPAFVRPDGVRDIDNVITTKDLGTLCRLKGIDAPNLEPVTFDSPFQTDGAGSGAGQLFGATGGVTEAAIRTCYFVATGENLPKLEFEPVRGLEGWKECVVPLHTEDGKGLPVDLKIAVVNGLANAKKIVAKIKEGEHYDFVEVMACPAGCINGGGQPQNKDKDAVQRRLDAMYNLDKNMPRRQSHEDPIVQEFYERFLGEAGSHKAHDLLHVKPVYGRGEFE